MNVPNTGRHALTFALGGSLAPSADSLPLEMPGDVTRRRAAAQA